ncbi:hypothetical protein [Paenibacillus sp. ATY16]|uniref:hypothetical protein n=1 Tax=Paenibacillus sp. ATY16 TaxID=1759312 RepID=UPI00200F4FED|nr:hypothetical protein [Paenibacillus sp. ATY16]MCK9859614.1 hypothetical protein [Paenibacillus sp. ATY16]
MNDQSNITSDEYSLIKNHCALPFVREMVKRNNDKIKLESYTLAPLFFRSGEILLTLIDNDIYEVRQQVRQLNAKITEVKRNSDGILYEISLRGYVSDFALLRHTLKQEMAKWLEKYISIIFRNQI